ncbi:hypothetical protein [Burkholderia ubonensis]|uniref:hypothetical protein n=1 Tax=Burkholderia ubonensis TaxID=101571 RepID=UPI0012F7BF04|nr:hypothetical protein [Burkholderia ubonensis]
MKMVKKMTQVDSERLDTVSSVVVASVQVPAPKMTDTKNILVKFKTTGGTDVPDSFIIESSILERFENIRNVILSAAANSNPPTLNLTTSGNYTNQGYAQIVGVAFQSV